MNQLEVGIVDTRNIIKTINDTYHYDFTDYALTSFKRRLEYVLALNNFRRIDDFIEELQTNKQFFEQFLHEVSVETTEMFRDPSLWRLLREELIPSIVTDNSPLKIWFPVGVTGEELYSLLILLKESNLLEKSTISLSCLSNNSIEWMRAGKIKLNKLETSDDNYKRFIGKCNLSDYYTKDQNFAYLDTSLLKNVTFFKQNITFDDSPLNIKLILFRNKMIYYNTLLQSRILRVMHRTLSSNGYFIIGTKEKLDGFNEFFAVNESESVYKKRLL
jgi:chemotaxis protein methyltransferase CheR